MWLLLYINIDDWAIEIEQTNDIKKPTYWTISKKKNLKSYFNFLLK